jgi:hypothetical protein
MTHHVLNLGAGVQSTWVYLAYARGEIAPCIDVAVFADTGEEPAAVYRHLAWLRSLNGPPIVVRSIGSRLGDDLLRGQNSTKHRFASIPAYTAAKEGVQTGIVRRQCTHEYKVRVIERYIRRELLGLRPGQRIPKDVHVSQAFGISVDEKSRASRIYERWIMGEAPFEPVFPLLDKRMTRADCVSWLREHVPHEVPRSACVFFPFKSDAEWRRLRETDPAGWERAIEIDDALRIPGNVVNRGLDQKLYIHRRCIPLRHADLDGVDRRQLLLDPSWENECVGMCGV